MRSIQEKLEHYIALLKKWQARINLVGKSTLEDAWGRHIEDSLQLSEHIPHGSNVLDMGSGAGFPGLALAIARSDLHVTLIESDERKCLFMRNVARETGTNVEILNERIESVSTERMVDVISARALASLEELLQYADPFRAHNSGLICLFLKGMRIEEELGAVRETHDLNFEMFPSRTNSDSCILKIKSF